MPLYHEEQAGRAPQVVVSGSVAAEIDWALAAGSRDDFRRDHAALTAMYQREPGLLERVRSFWAPGETTSCGGSIELIVLAHRGDVLFSLDADRLVDHLGELCADAPLELPLGSENEQDRRALLARLARLRSSPETRRRYAELVGDVWAALEADWDREGASVVSAEVAQRRELQHKGAPWREVAHNNGCEFGDLLSGLVSGLGPDGVVAVVPAYFAHFGSLVDLPGTVLIGVQADGSGAQARARTEVLARRLRTISDPTRLAILEVLRTRPRSVSELAELFSLAQPTVSNHVKILRESGIVANGTDGERRKLVVRPEVLADLLEHLEGVLRVPGGRGGT